MKFTDALASKLDSISEQLAVMGDGAESVALILSNWQNVVSSVSLASLAVANHAKGPSQNTEPMPETLVRLRLQDQDAQADE
ncbi:hypothetical protein JCM33374_g5222 [Metschnikowia sp. JCM 33374]|nr:hypothetical protein JCM33374_g5222 [Metschnikowia sp. JCM 33374]